MSVMYSAAITDALTNNKITLKELRVLEHHAEGILQSQGDLKGALEKLKTRIKEVESREGS